MQSWEKAKNDILARRDSEKETLKEQLREQFSAQQEEFKERRKSVQEEFGQRINVLYQEKNTLTNRLTALSFYQVAEKKAIRERIPAIDVEINTIRQQQTGAVLDVDRQRQMAEREFQNQMAGIDRTIAMRYPIPVRPDAMAQNMICRIAVSSEKENAKKLISNLTNGKKAYWNMLKTKEKKYLT